MAKIDKGPSLFKELLAYSIADIFTLWDEKIMFLTTSRINCKKYNIGLQTQFPHKPNTDNTFKELINSISKH